MMINFSIPTARSGWLYRGLLLVFIAALTTQAQPLLTESFNYPVGTTLTSTNWTQRDGGTPTITVASGNLSYAGTIANNIGNKVVLGSSGQDVYRTFTASNRTMYSSMVVNVTSAQATGDYFFVMGNSTSPLTYGTRIAIRANGSGFSFGIARGNSTPVYETVERSFGTNYFLVLKYEVVSGSANDVAKLYVDHVTLLSEPVTPSIVYDVAGGSDINASYPLSAINLYQGTAANAPALEIDGIHVGPTWESVATAQYDYGDAPGSYELSKDGLSIPAGHSIVTNLRLGSLMPGADLAPHSVAAGEDNNTPNGDGNEEDAIALPIEPIKQGLAYSLVVPVNSPSTATKYLYAWIDFNNNGRFEAGELTTTAPNFTTSGATTRTLTWTALQTSAIPSETSKLYMRLRLSDRILYDFTTAASGGATLDERSIGNGAISASNAANAALTPGGEIEDFQVEVVRLYDFGDLPLSYEQDKDGNSVPARHAQLEGLTIGSLIDIEGQPASVPDGEPNNGDGDNEFDLEDEDGLTELVSISRGVAYSINVPLTVPSGTKYLYAWLDLNGNGRFEANELTTTAANFTETGSITRTLNWNAAQTSSIPLGTKKIYLRLRLSNTILYDFTTSASGGAILDERSIGSGATSTTNSALVATIAPGEIEDYQLPVDDYDYGDAPVSYENGVPARQIASPNFRIGEVVANESAPNNVSTGEDNNGINGDGEEEDGITGDLPVITKGAKFSFSVPVTVNTASVITAWIDFNNDGKFQLSEASYATPAATSPAYTSVAAGTSNVTFYFRGSQTHQIPAGLSNVYVRIRLTNATTSQSSDNASTTDIDERSIGDGASTGAYGTPYIGEIEDYRFAVVTDLDYGDAPVSYEQNQSGESLPARNFATDELYIGQSYVLENGPSSVSAGSSNNAPDGDGDEEDGLDSSQLFVRLGGINAYQVFVNNTTGAAATLHGWIDFNNNGRFETGEYASVSVPNNTNGPVTLSFTLAQANTIPAAAQKLYMRMRLIQPNVEFSIADQASSTNVDERAIGDGLNTGTYSSVALGEVEDYQLTIIKDFGDVPISYENGSPAFQSNTATPELFLGGSVDYELAAQSVTAGDDNNLPNGDGSDEDAVAEQHTITVGAPFMLTVPVTSTVAATRYLFAWIDFNGDGVFNGNELASPSNISTVAGVTNVTLTWTAAQTSTATPAVISAGKTYARLRLSATNMTNTNAATSTLIDTRSFGPGNASGEIEDYQFLVSNQNDYGDAPASYEMSANATSELLPARQAASNTLRLGLTVDNESSPASVSDGDDNNGSNGDGADEDGITNLAPIYSGIAYRTQVSVYNNTGAARTLHAWIDFDNNGRFTSNEYTSFSVPNSTAQQTVTLAWPAQTFTPPANNKLYMRLRISEGTLADRTTSPNPALVDERSIGDGLSSGLLGTLQPGEIEDYQLTVISDYDYGDADLASYEENDASVSVPARQAVNYGLYLGKLYPDAEPSKQVSSDAQGDNDNGVNDEDGAVPGPITAGGGYTLNVTYTNNTGAARTLYGWIDFNNNGRFESGEMTSVSLSTGAYDGVATLSWSTAQTNPIPAGTEKLNMRLRVSEQTLATNSSILDERAIGDGLNTGVYGANAANGEIEDYTIQVTTDLDYGDAPLSYDQPNGTLLPARQISNAALQIGSTPDVEPTALSVSDGADNNGTNGDGEDEDGITPENHPVTVNSAFTLPVRVTNTVGATRTLYGWLDLNGNGTFDDDEVQTVNVASGTNNGVVNLTWTAVQTRAIQSEKIYLRLRLADGTLANNTATTYDERAFADGLNTGAYGPAPTRGEIEDYQLAVIPAFDFGDAPLSFEENNSGVVVPARHLTASTLYLGSSFSVDYGPSSVAEGADNNGTNGDGSEEDGVTSLPVLYPGSSYGVSVNVFKSISGTGTIHAWLDLDGDGQFSVREYTSATVTAATGAQTVNLLWTAAPYSSPNNYTYMRLRFTTASVTDNATTTLVDERSIGDGLSTGIYGTPINGEIEDYRIEVDKSGTPAPAPCFGLGAIDPIQAAFHATMIRPAAGGYMVFGEGAHGNGVSNLNTPVKLESGANGFNFQGEVLMATLASTYINYHQYFVLTTAGLYAWGARGIAIPTATTTSNAIQAIDLPPGVNPARVKMIDAGASYYSSPVQGSQGSLAILTTTGEIWVRTSMNVAGTSNASNAVQGDGNLAENNSFTGWHQVQTAPGVPLTGMVDVRSTGAAMIATDGNNFYTWGRNVYTGTGPTTTLHYATPMELPAGFAGPARQVDISYGSNLSASYYVLDQNGVVHVLGNNDVGQLGLGNTTAQTSWQQITTIKEQPNDPGKQADVARPIGRVNLISANNHDSRYAHLIVITEEQIAYHTGSNAGGGGMSGTVNADDRTTLTAMTTANGAMMLPGKMVFGEAGGHIGVLAKEGSDRYGYVGHTINGSDGCGGCTGNPSEYNFDKTTSTGPLCGIEAFDFGDLDDRYNLGDKAKHQIKYAQAENPLKLGSIAPDSDDAPQATSVGPENTADGDDNDENGDDEDAFSGTLPVKIAGNPYTLNVPLTNNTGTTAYLYGFIDWNADGVFAPSEAAIATVPSSASAQTVSLTWPDPGFDAAQCAGELDYTRSFVRLRLTTTELADNTATPEDERSYEIAYDGEVEDYYLDWVPPFENFDYGNLPVADAAVTWPQASATLLSLDLSNTTRVWLGDDNSYPNTACVSNEERNGGLVLTREGNPVAGDGTAGNPFVISSTSSPTELAYSITVNGNGAAGTPVYWAVWFDANGNGSFTDADDVFRSGVTNHGGPVTISEPFTFNPGGSNAGATNGAIRLVATANSTVFSKEQNGTVSVQNGEVEDFYVAYRPSFNVSGTIYNDNNGQTEGANGNTVDGTDPDTPLFVNLYDSNGNFVQSAPVGPDGTYTLVDIPAGTGYQIQISATEGQSGDELEPNATLPGDFVNVSSNGDSGNPADGVIVFDISESPVTGMDFGINETPTATPVAVSPQLNPGGTNSTDITNTFAGTDPNGGEIVSITITEFPENATSLTVGTTTYYPTAGDIPGACPTATCAVFPTSGGVVIPVSNGEPELPISVDPIDGEVTVEIPYTVTDEAGLTSAPAQVSVPFGTGTTISGTVFNDANGNGSKQLTENGTNLSGSLTVYLVDGDGKVVDKAPVSADGSYSVTGQEGVSYTLILSTNAAVGVGDPAPTTPSLPVGGTWEYENTGDEYGSNNSAGTGVDANTPGVISVTPNGAVTGVNFGINAIPVAHSVNNPGLNSSAFSSTPPTSYPTVNGFVSIPYNTLPNVMNGSDLEDGTLSHSGTTITFTVVNDNTQLYYDFGGTVGVQPVTAGTIIEDFDPTKLVIYGEVGSGDASDPLGFNYQLTDAAGAISAPAPFTLSTTTPLPVTLIRFTVAKEGNTAQLSWSTTSEHNSAYFDVEHSVDGKNWTAIGRVKAQGESNIRKDYGFVHATLARGINYYRLRMVDVDGSFGYSEIRSVSVNEKSLTLYPNPATEGKLTIDVPDAAGSLVKVYSSTGVELISQTLSGRTLDIRKLPSGIYVLRVTGADGVTLTKSFIVE